MKRFSCVSAMSVGLLLFTFAGVASAAPDRPVLVAQAKGQPSAKTIQPSDPTPAGGGADPTAAPPAAAAPSEDPSTAEAAPPPASGLTIGPPAADAPNASAADPAKAPKPRPWSGTQVFAATTMTTATVFKGQNQDYNPTVDSYAAITPRYALSPAFQLRGRIVFSYEYTNSDTTKTNNEPRFGDALVQLFYRKIPEIPKTGIKPLVALNAGLPTSPESRARTLIVNPGLSLQLFRSFEKLLPGGGELDLLVASAYAHPLYRKTTPEIRGEAPYQFQCLGGGASCGSQLSGAFNPSDTLSYTALVSATWGKWSPALFYIGSSQRVYKGQEIQFQGRSIETQGFRPTNVRQSSYFAAWLDYEANAWLTAEVGYTLTRSALNEDGSRGNPIFDRYQDQRVYLGVNVNIDNIMKQLEGGPAEGGVIRAQNKRPIGMF